MQRLCNADKNGEYRTLFIIDNYNITFDVLSENPDEMECWDMLCQIRCKRLITSTYVWERYVSISIGRIGIEYEVDLFKAHSEEAIYSNKELRAINEICNEFDGHTYAIEIAARWICFYRMKSNTQPSQILQIIKKSGLPELASHNNSVTSKYTNRTDKTERIIAVFIRNLLDKTKEFANDSAIQLLYCAALFPISGFQKELTDRLFTHFDSEVIYYVRKMEWLKFETNNDRVTVRMHPIISQVMMNDVIGIPEQHEEIFHDFLEQLWQYIRIYIENNKNLIVPTTETIDIFEQLVKITNRIVRNNIRCGCGVRICTILTEFSDQLLHIVFFPKEYELYTIAMVYKFSSPYCPETEAIYNYNKIMHYFDIDFLENKQKSKNANNKYCSDILNLFFYEWNYPTAFGFHLGKMYLDNFFAVLNECNLDNLGITAEEIKQFECYRYTTYSKVTEILTKHYEDNKNRWLKQYMVSPYDGEKKQITEEILYATWCCRLGHNIETNIESGEDFSKAEELLQTSLKIVRNSEDKKFCQFLELWNLDYLSKLYINQKQYEEGCIMCNEMISLILTMNPHEYCTIGNTYLKLGYIYCKTCNATAVDSLLKAYEYFTKLNESNDNDLIYRWYDQLFITCEYLCYAYQKICRNLTLAKRYYDEAVNFPIKASAYNYRLFGVLLENSHKPISVLLENWDNWIEQLEQIDSEETKKIKENFKVFIDMDRSEFMPQ